MAKRREEESHSRKVAECGHTLALRKTSLLGKCANEQRVLTDPSSIHANVMAAGDTDQGKSSYSGYLKRDVLRAVVGLVDLGARRGNGRFT